MDFVSTGFCCYLFFPSMLQDGDDLSAEQGSLPFCLISCLQEKSQPGVSWAVAREGKGHSASGVYCTKTGGSQLGAGTQTGCFLPLRAGVPSCAAASWNAATWDGREGGVHETLSVLFVDFTGGKKKKQQPISVSKINVFEQKASLLCKEEFRGLTEPLCAFVSIYSNLSLPKSAILVVKKTKQETSLSSAHA